MFAWACAVPTSPVPFAVAGPDRCLHGQFVLADSDALRLVLARVPALSCDVLMRVPIDASLRLDGREGAGGRIPTVLFGRRVADDRYDTITIDNVSAARQVPNYLLDLGHRRIATITGPLI